MVNPRICTGSDNQGDSQLLGKLTRTNVKSYLFYYDTERLHNLIILLFGFGWIRELSLHDQAHWIRYKRI